MHEPPTMKQKLSELGDSRTDAPRTAAVGLTYRLADGSAHLVTACGLTRVNADGTRAA